MRIFALTVFCAAMIFGRINALQAGPVFSTGSGTAVITADRTATFDSINQNGIDLSSYSEDNLSITVPDTSKVAFDPFSEAISSEFHYGDGGNFSYVTIRGTDSAVFDGVEFKFGSGWFESTTTPGLIWETLLNGTVTGSGGVSLLAHGSIVGWSDPDGFDELRVASVLVLTSTSSFGNLQAIALDDLNVQLKDETPTVPEPASMALWGLGSLGIGVIARRRNRKQTELSA